MSKLKALFALVFITMCFTDNCWSQTNHDDMIKSVVMIASVTQDQNFSTPWKQASVQKGIGSGVIIDGQRILTNAHNVSNAKYIVVKKQNYAKKHLARVEYIGNDCDLAVLKVDDSSFFENTTPVQIGDLPAINSTVQTYGFPMGGNLLSVTKGVVSRIEIQNYSHSGGDMHLVIQTDAAINPGNSGGPVMQDDKIVGIAFQGLTTADNIGYMIPTTIVKHFLKDIEDGKYDGYPSLGFDTYPGLHSKTYAQYLKIPQDQQGMVVIQTQLNSSVAGKISPDDCITKIDGYEIDNDGNIFIHGLLLNFNEVVEQKQVGETIELTFYRDGKLNTETITLAQDLPIPNYSKIYDKNARFYTYGGVVFVPLTRNFLETWGDGWLKKIPSYLKLLFFHSNTVNKDPELEEYIVVSDIMPDDINSYCGKFKFAVLKNVNGQKVNSLNDLAKLLKNTKDEFVVFDFHDRIQSMILNREQAQASSHRIMKQYNVTSFEQLEDGK